MTYAKGSLQENSEIYHERSELYEELSRAEDAEGLALDFLLPHARGKDVLDLGCGTGKYLELLAPHCRRIVGIDAALPQLLIARSRTAGMPHVETIHGDALGAPIPLPRFDTAIACWMLGTVLDPARRMAIIERVQSMLAPGGIFLLVENDSEGDFEEIRGRTASSSAYNHWLCSTAGFSRNATLHSRFLFDSPRDAQRIIGSIWGPEAGSHACRADIPHRIAVFSKRT